MWCYAWMFVFQSHKSWNRTRHAMCTVTFARLTEQQFDQGLSQNIRFTSLSTETALYIRSFCVCLTSVACNRHGIEARLCDNKCNENAAHRLHCIRSMGATNALKPQLHKETPHFKHFSIPTDMLGWVQLRFTPIFCFPLWNLWIACSSSSLLIMITSLVSTVLSVLFRLNLASQRSKTKKLYVSWPRKTQLLTVSPWSRLL